MTLFDYNPDAWQTQYNDIHITRTQIGGLEPILAIAHRKDCDTLWLFNHNHLLGFADFPYYSAHICQETEL